MTIILNMKEPKKTKIIGSQPKCYATKCKKFVIIAIKKNET